MVAWADWLRNWRNIADGVPDGYYEAITSTIDDRDYDVLHISGYDVEVDGDRRVVRTSARDFDDKVALFTRRTRDIGLIRLICVRGSPRFVLEPGADVLDWAAAVEGVSVRDLAQSVRDGTLGRRVARLVRNAERRSRERADAELQALRERVEDLEAEAETLTAELRRRERDLARRDRL